jgi:hypothetical protein
MEMPGQVDRASGCFFPACKAANSCRAAVVGSRRALALHEQGMGERGP